MYIKLDDEKALENFYVDVATIAEKLGVRDQLDQINADSFDEYIDQLKDIFKGNMLIGLLLVKNMLKQLEVLELN